MRFPRGSQFRMAGGYCRPAPALRFRHRRRAWPPARIAAPQSASMRRLFANEVPFAFGGYAGRKKEINEHQFGGELDDDRILTGKLPLELFLEAVAGIVGIIGEACFEGLKRLLGPDLLSLPEKRGILEKAPVSPRVRQPVNALRIVLRVPRHCAPMAATLNQSTATHSCTSKH